VCTGAGRPKVEPNANAGKLKSSGDAGKLAPHEPRLTLPQVSD